MDLEPMFLSLLSASSTAWFDIRRCSSSNRDRREGRHIEDEDDDFVDTAPDLALALANRYVCLHIVCHREDHTSEYYTVALLMCVMVMLCTRAKSSESCDCRQIIL